MPEAEPGRTLYQQIADRLREEILSGRLNGGQRLEPEQELARRFGASRITIRSALEVLKREGLVVTRQGLGSFVRAVRVRQVLARLEPLDDAVAEQGLAPTTRLLDFAFVVAPEAACTALDLPAGSEVLLTRRLHSAHDEPLAYVSMYLRPELGEQLSRRDLEAHQHPVFELLPVRLGIEIGPATQNVRAEAASAEVARALRIKEGAPVLVCERTTFDADGRPIVFNIFVFRADRFEFRVSLSPHEWKVPWGPPGLAATRQAEADA